MHELNTALGSTCEKYELASPDPYSGSRDSIKCVMVYLLNIYVTPQQTPLHSAYTALHSTHHCTQHTQHYTAHTTALAHPALHSKHHCTQHTQHYTAHTTWHYTPNTTHTDYIHEQHNVCTLHQWNHFFQSHSINTQHRSNCHHCRHCSACSISPVSDKHITKEDGSYINALEVLVSSTSNHYIALRRATDACLPTQLHISATYRDWMLSLHIHCLHSHMYICTSLLLIRTYRDTADRETS